MLAVQLASRKAVWKECNFIAAGGAGTIDRRLFDRLGACTHANCHVLKRETMLVSFGDIEGWLLACCMVYLC